MTVQRKDNTAMKEHNAVLATIKGAGKLTDELAWQIADAVTLTWGSLAEWDKSRKRGQKKWCRREIMRSQVTNCCTAAEFDGIVYRYKGSEALLADAVMSNTNELRYGVANQMISWAKEHGAGASGE